MSSVSSCCNFTLLQDVLQWRSVKACALIAAAAGLRKLIVMDTSSRFAAVIFERPAVTIGAPPLLCCIVIAAPVQQLAAP
jgi:hypothetical protein